MNCSYARACPYPVLAGETVCAHHSAVLSDNGRLFLQIRPVELGEKSEPHRCNYVKPSKLNADQVERIRAARASGALVGELAISYQVSQSLISRVARGVGHG